MFGGLSLGKLNLDQMDEVGYLSTSGYDGLVVASEIEDATSPPKFFG